MRQQPKRNHGTHVLSWAVEDTAYERTRNHNKGRHRQTSRTDHVSEGRSTGFQSFCSKTESGGGSLPLRGRDDTMSRLWCALDAR
ncbi:hypothetical protein ACS15_4479 [Ralstonia insidiosa]|uniref:Uncharacterized protein n=1 Tax=Ralstonia insidiosa TaxID=190721 RepID=A0AAC9BJZ9_9RALS|nr:hypothetical protein ACS15_4479 [Ralstonia insidiosa]